MQNQPELRTTDSFTPHEMNIVFQAERYVDYQLVLVRQEHHRAEVHESNVKLMVHAAVLVTGLTVAVIFATLSPAAMAVITGLPAIAIEFTDRMVRSLH